MNLPDLHRGSELTVPATTGTSPGTFMANASADRLDLRFLATTFRRRLSLFLGIVGIFVLLAFAFTLTQPKLFRASADVVVNKDKGAIVPNEGAAEAFAPLRSEEIDTQLKIIKSQELAAQVITALKLDQDRAFREAALGGSGITGWLKRLSGKEPPVQAPADLKRSLADALLANVKADRMETAYAIRISFTSPSAAHAAAVANGIATAYANSAVNTKRLANQKDLALLRSRIDELRTQAQADFKAVQDFRVRNNLLSAQATQLSELEASAYGQQLAAARAAAASAQGMAGNSGGAGQAALVTSPVVSSLRSQRAALSIRVAEMSGRYLDTHPDLILARRELSDIDGQISAEISRVRSGVSAGLASNAQASAQQVGALQGNLSTARATLAANNRALVGLDDLSRKAQASQSLYDGYLGRYKEVVAQSGTERPDARIISAAKMPAAPISPNLLLNLALGLVIGTLLGAGTAIATESAFSGLTTGEEVEARLGMRYLGGVPLLASINVKAETPLASLISDPSSAYAEAVRGLLSSNRSSDTDRGHVVAITSALPGEGKTSLAASMARLAALAGESVIVIDCDLVRHNLSAIFVSEPSRPGLREMMRDGAKLGDAMIKDPASNAMILPITTPFAQGERLLERGHFHTMIAVLREHFRLIILDGAPILPIAETREVVSLADTVIVAALWRKTPDAAIRAALKLLPQHLINNIGIVLNQIDMKKQVHYGAGDATFYYSKYQKYYVALEAS